MNSPVLAFTDYMKDFLLETDASKEGLGAVLSRNRKMDGFTRWPMAAGCSPHMKELPFHETGVSGTEMGCYGTF